MLQRHRISALPVITATGQLLGIVTRMELLLPVLDAANRVIGMMTQADLIAALFRAHGKTESRKDHT